MTNRIRERRKALGLSQIQLASRLGIAQGALSNLELSKWQPWPKVKRDLSRVLGMPEEELFGNSNALASLNKLLGHSRAEGDSHVR